jgi:hypothetical protein
MHRPSWQSPTANNRINNSQSQYYLYSTLCLNINLHLIICRTGDDKIRIQKHDSHESHVTHNMLRGENHVISKGTKGSWLTERKWDPIYPYPYCGLVSALSNNTTYTVIYSDRTGPSMGMTAVASMYGICTYIGHTDSHFPPTVSQEETC